MRALAVDGFEALNDLANRDPAGFHDMLIRFLDLRFERPCERVPDLRDGMPFARWCVGGVTNVVLNRIDRRRGTARYGCEALVWEGADGAVTTGTFADLDRGTSRLAWRLRRPGLGRVPARSSRGWNGQVSTSAAVYPSAATECAKFRSSAGAGEPDSRITRGPRPAGGANHSWARAEPASGQAANRIAAGRRRRTCS